jgi:hypothetical protein
MSILTEKEKVTQPSKSILCEPEILHIPYSSKKSKFKAKSLPQIDKYVPAINVSSQKAPIIILDLSLAQATELHNHWLDSDDNFLKTIAKSPTADREYFVKVRQQILRLQGECRPHHSVSFVWIFCNAESKAFPLVFKT